MTTVLAIGDTQAPFHHRDYTRFIKAVIKKYKPKVAVHVGDIFDQYFANAWGKTARAKDTLKEFEEALDWLHNDLRPVLKGLKEVYIIGNHDERIFKRADEASIHEMFLKPMKELYNLPNNVVLDYEYVIDNIMYTHGHRTQCNSNNASEILTKEYEMPVVYGHFHSKAGIEYIANRNRLVFGFNVGCGIDRHAYAFDYAKTTRNKPILGVGLIIDGLPIYIPMLLNKKHRWVGKL